MTVYCYLKIMKKYILKQHRIAKIIWFYFVNFVKCIHLYLTDFQKKKHIIKMRYINAYLTVMHNFHCKSWAVTVIYFRTLPYIMTNDK